jgi:hypothetical protein
VLSGPVIVSAVPLNLLHSASQHDSLRRLGQKAYQVLATHRRAEMGGEGAGYCSLGSSMRRAE